MFTLCLTLCFVNVLLFNGKKKKKKKKAFVSVLELHYFFDFQNFWPTRNLNQKPIIYYTHKS